MGARVSTSVKERAPIATKTAAFGPPYNNKPSANNNNPWSSVFPETKPAHPAANGRHSWANEPGTRTAVAPPPPKPASGGQIIAFHSSSRWKAYFDSSKNSNKLMVIYFTATWCVPCRKMEPALKEIAAKYSTDVEFVKIDVDELFNISREYGVQAMPTFVFIKKGKEVDKVVGAKKEELQRKIIEKIKV